MDLKLTIHYSFHFIVPAIIAYLFFKENWKKVYLVFIVTMLIDIDHLVANPIFDPNRCSINFHPLHSYIAISIYFLLSIWKKSRILAIGLLLHILADSIDCFL